MNIMFLYKIAKKKQENAAPKSIQRVDIPTLQKSRISEAESKHGERIERMITPHIDIDAVQKENVVPKSAQDYGDNIDYSATFGNNGLIRPPTLNEKLKKNYIKRLFEDNYNNNFNIIGNEDLI